MKQNVGKTDKIIRIAAGIALLLLLFVAEGSLRWVGLLGIPLIASAVMGFCFLYVPLGISTNCCCGSKACDKGEEKAE